MNIEYINKYLKYKNKYLELKKQIDGGFSPMIKVPTVSSSSRSSSSGTSFIPKRTKTKQELEEELEEEERIKELKKKLKSIKNINEFKEIISSNKDYVDYVEYIFNFVIKQENDNVLEFIEYLISIDKTLLENVSLCDILLTKNITIIKYFLDNHLDKIKLNNYCYIKKLPTYNKNEPPYWTILNMEIEPEEKKTAILKLLFSKYIESKYIAKLFTDLLLIKNNNYFKLFYELISNKKERFQIDITNNSNIFTTQNKDTAENSVYSYFEILIIYIIIDMKEEIYRSRRYNDNIEKNINFMLDNNEEENIDINGNPSILSILTLRNNNNYNMIKESSFGAKDIFIKFYKLHLLLYLRIIRYNLKNNIVDPINILKYMVNNDVNQNKAFEAQIKMFLTIPLYDEILKKLWIEIIEIFIKYFQSKKIELEAEITNINKLIIEIKKIKPINKILLSENNNKLSTKKEELTKFKKYIDTFGDMLKKINKIKIQIQIKK